MKKKLLILGGSYAQVPFIRNAAEKGFYVILVDYLENNPGRNYAHEYYNISTTDKEEILKLARNIRPDLIFSYASDPAAPVVAYVSEKLNLFSNSLRSVQLLARKDLFRHLLETSGFNCPKYLTVSNNGFNHASLTKLDFPVIVKPVDASGSKGVSKVETLQDLSEAIKTAGDFSRSKNVIIETFIDNQTADVHGDGFVVEGKVILQCLGDHMYGSNANPFNPTGTSWPSAIDRSLLQKIEDDIQKIVTISGFRNGAINIEARIDKLGDHYIMEIGPRNGGHFVPLAIKYATGFDSLAATFDLIENKKITIQTNEIVPSAYIALHSDVDGILQNIYFSEKIKPFVRDFHQYIQVGEIVRSFTSADLVIGIVILTFNSVTDMEHYLGEIKSLILVEIIQK
ncbi:ATP-grasp domain-containing protein [Kaistella daneshvariae]|uniref:ATP-grasp domain-containing protein n=1 Tax=Kaistella daneshvariae TaxID=2487074 RepID=A0ABM7C6Q0_9FLAO|nr:ATP-grasp domain-containing protein [Kaistella daneshvariae]AZI66637.1 ATP-grasp domain-containing protein [Kaistella daneshvariae]